MVAELDLLEVWIPEQMQPGTLFMLEKGRRPWQAGKPVLGCAGVSFLWLAGADHAAAMCGAGGYDLWFG
jgi:hypothetical protein